MGEIHELFVLALSLVWFAGATPEICNTRKPVRQHFDPYGGHVCKRGMEAHPAAQLQKYP